MFARYAMTKHTQSNTKMCTVNFCPTELVFTTILLKYVQANLVNCRFLNSLDSLCTHRYQPFSINLQIQSSSKSVDLKAVWRM